MFERPGRRKEEDPDPSLLEREREKISSLHFTPLLPQFASWRVSPFCCPFTSSSSLSSSFLSIVFSHSFSFFLYSFASYSGVHTPERLIHLNPHPFTRSSTCLLHSLTHPFTYFLPPSICFSLRKDKKKKRKEIPYNFLFHLPSVFSSRDPRFVSFSSFLSFSPPL